MPTYDYQCEKCGHMFEVFQSMADEPVRDCPVEGCGGKVKRLLSGGGGVIFKGKGFHATDYRAKSPCGATGDSCPASGPG